MIGTVVFYLLNKLIGDDEMMALLLAQRVILMKLEFEAVPVSLKPLVYEHLTDSGVEFLAGEYEPPVTDIV